MWIYKIYFLPLTFLLASSVCAVDRTRENGASGSTVVEAVVDLLRARCILSDDNFFLRRMAYAASKDGEDSDTYRAGFDGGIWQITKQQLRITQTSSLLTNQRTGVRGNFSISWSQVTWSDLRKPLYSGIAAALYLQYVEDYYNTAIPNTINEQGQFWVDRFNGKMADFLTVMNLKEVSCDMKPVDLVLVVDESGSIGSSNFIRMKNFLKELVDQITISNAAFNVGLVKFHKRATTEFSLDRYSHKSSIKSAIQGMSYHEGGTHIGAGIELAREVFKDSKRNDATKVMILLTDGRSSSKIETAQQARQAQAEGVSIFVIGIGNVDPDEITSAASQPTCVHVFLLEGFSSIDNILYEVRRRSCKAPTKVEIVNQKETKVDGVLSPDQVVEDTVEIDSPAPATTITTEVNCGEVELFASANTTSPSAALYEAKGLARDNQPALFSIQNGGRTVYVYYKGKIISTTNACKNLQKTFSISFTQASDFCKSNPCENGATCVDQSSDFTCRCPSGYDGKRCENDIDECRNNPCTNGGRCENIVNGYKCVCVPGYTGNTCEVKVDRCASSPCQNGGSCSNVNNDFVCNCRQGFSGKSCGVDVNECQPSPCLNGGMCRDLVNDFTCQCQTGYSGKTCDVNIDDCAPNPCQNGGSCQDLVNDFRCSCSNGYTGKTCEVVIDHCKPSPCRNAGSCVNSVGDYSCVCPSGFTGKNCENVTTVLMCRVGSIDRECTAEDIQGSSLANQICTQQQIPVQSLQTTTPKSGSGSGGSTVCVPKGYIYHIPYPGNKSKFIQCDEYGGSTIMPCSPGTEFNELRQVCTGNGVCPSTDYVKLPHPTNPGKYYECVHGVSYLRACPGSLVFDENRKYCTWATSRRQFNGDDDKTKLPNTEDVKFENMREVTDDEKDSSFEDQVKRLGEKNDIKKISDSPEKRLKLEKIREILKKYLA